MHVFLILKAITSLGVRVVAELLPCCSDETCSGTRAALDTIAVGAIPQVGKVAGAPCQALQCGVSVSWEIWDFQQLLC